MANNFHNYWRTLNWDDLSILINKKNAYDIEQALSADNLTLENFMALISPAASDYLEPLAQRAQQLTRQRFGHIVGFYIPLYLSNLCANDCTYCGFSMSNRIKRKVLDEVEIERECLAIKSQGFEHILLVTGEQQSKVGMNYFRQCIPVIRSHFSSLMIEVQPLTQQEYSELKQLGVDGVIVYQETYHSTTYLHHHLHGKKRDFYWRLNTPDRLGLAEIDKIGLGTLIGLSENWRTDCYLLAEHLFYLQQTYWRSRYSISFPRLRPCTGGIQPASILTNAQLVQLICAFRIFFPDVELSLSTRESAFFRDHMIPIAINSVSAGSKTQPGGYTNDKKLELEQFEPQDGRTPKQLAKAIIDAGLQPVWKDWDHYFGRGL